MLNLRDVSAALGGVTIVHDVDLQVADGEIVGLLGPSGAGKSTLLRVIAGLVPLTQGVVKWAGEDLTNVPPHLRNFGFMFQDYALFPHRTVGRNVGFGLEMQGVPDDQIASKVGTSLDWVGLSGMEKRAVSSLSGGEQQRVALARALAPKPRLLLLDEPVGSLDRELRTRLIDELADMLRERELTTIVVTHDQGEAFGLADRVAVMRNGRIVACAAPDRLWREPPDEWTARFLGMTNIVDDPQRGKVLVRPEAISIDPKGEPATIESVSFDEGRYRLVTTTASGRRLTFTTATAFTPGEEILISIDPTGVVDLSN
ncbi:MAG: ABC transporter ATP-binding protein [Acidimicrobiia bacterium]|nr:ABC transporter ATP-binding protein [Acidimicrobiia bacterium]